MYPDHEATDLAMRHVTMVINAVALTDAHPERFEQVIARMKQKQDKYRDLYDEARRNNKRVYVESTVVGNHYYQVSSGWTWVNLVAKYPKAFALDPEPSAPGQEPVVVPVRIISLDKLAKKAGGLCVALDGVVVKPGDDANILKDYTLVPLSGSTPAPTPTPEPSGDDDDQGGSDGGGEVTPVTPE